MWCILKYLDLISPKLMPNWFVGIYIQVPVLSCHGRMDPFPCTILATLETVILTWATNPFHKDHTILLLNITYVLLTKNLGNSTKHNNMAIKVQQGWQTKQKLELVWWNENNCVVFMWGCWARYKTISSYVMTIDRTSIGKMALEFLHHFSFNRNLLANILLMVMRS